MDAGTPIARLAVAWFPDHATLSTEGFKKTEGALGLETVGRIHGRVGKPAHNRVHATTFRTASGSAAITRSKVRAA